MIKLAPKLLPGNMSIEASVIIPIFNKVKYLRHCLESVFNQTLEAIEVICIKAAFESGRGSWDL